MGIFFYVLAILAWAIIRAPYLDSKFVFAAFLISLVFGAPIWFCTVTIFATTEAAFGSLQTKFRHLLFLCFAIAAVGFLAAYISRDYPQYFQYYVYPTAGVAAVYLFRSLLRWHIVREGGAT